VNYCYWKGNATLSGAKTVVNLDVYALGYCKEKGKPPQCRARARAEFVLAARRPFNSPCPPQHPAHGSTDRAPDQALPDLRQAGAAALPPVLLEALRRHRPPPLARRPLRGPGGRRGRE